MNDNNLVFSIIIPVFNEEKLLDLCLKSIFDTRYSKYKYEVIVVNNNSTDKSSSIAKKYPVYLIDEKQQGIVAARNAGFKKASGQIFINLDADCIVPANWLELYYDRFNGQNDLVWVSGVYKTEELSIVKLITQTIPVVLEKIFSKSLAYCGGNVAIKKDIFIKCGGYDLRYPNSDQLSLLCRIQKYGKAMYDPSIIVISSDRRTKGRLITVCIEMLSYFLDILTVKLIGRSVLRWKAIR